MDAIQSTLAMAELSIALLLEAKDRLEWLCSDLEESKKEECTATIKHISAQVENLRGQMSVLKRWLTEHRR